MEFNRDYNQKISFETILNAYKESKEKINIDDIRFYNNMTRSHVERLKKDDPARFNKLSINSKHFYQVGMVRMALLYYCKDYETYLEKLKGINNNRK